MLYNPHPTYSGGYAHDKGESMFPGMWDGLTFVVAPFLGATGDLKELKGGNDGVWSGTGPRWVGGAAQYNGSDDYTNHSIAIDTSGAISVSFWNFVATADIQQSSAFGYRGTDVNADRFQAHVPWSDSNVYWDYGDIGGNGRISVSYAGFFDKWTHVALVSEGKGGSFKGIYLDGVLKASAGSSDGPDGVIPIDIGRAVISSTEYHKGRISQFAIYNRLLVANEIQQHYRNPKGLFVRQPPVTYFVAAAAANAPTATLYGPLYGPLGGPIG